MRLVKFNVGFLLVSFMSVFVTGCVPIVTRYVSAPGAVGRAVDGDAHTPLVGAVVSVSHPHAAPAQTRTRRDGTFRVRPKHSWYVYDWLQSPCTCVFAPAPAEVSVESKGYQTYATNILVDTEVFDAGEVRLYRPTK
jgi:hypothetical protein